MHVRQFGKYAVT